MVDEERVESSHIDVVVAIGFLPRRQSVFAIVAIDIATFAVAVRIESSLFFVLSAWLL